MNLTCHQAFAHLWPCAGVLVIALDQISKWLVLALAKTWRRHAGRRPRINVCLNRETGIASLPTSYVCLLLIAVSSGSFVAIQMLPATAVLSGKFCLSIALAGAIGNLIDLSRRGAIVDFIDLRIWPVFNLADACIVAGTGGLLWLMI